MDESPEGELKKNDTGHSSQVPVSEYVSSL